VDRDQVRLEVEAKLRERIAQLEAVIKSQSVEIERLSRKLISMWGEA
jgi:hypothetical protein